MKITISEKEEEEALKLLDRIQEMARQGNPTESVYLDNEGVSDADVDEAVGEFITFRSLR